MLAAHLLVWETGKKRDYDLAHKKITDSPCLSNFEVSTLIYIYAQTTEYTHTHTHTHTCICYIYIYIKHVIYIYNSNIYITARWQLGFSGGSAGKESACNAGDLGLIPGLGRSPGERNSYPLQESDLDNSMYCIVHGVTESDTMFRLISTNSLYVYLSD